MGFSASPLPADARSKQYRKQMNPWIFLAIKQSRLIISAGS